MARFMLAIELPIDYQYKRKLAEFTNLVRQLNEDVTKLEEFLSDFTSMYKRREKRGVEWCKMNIVDIDLKITETITQLNTIYSEYKKAISEILSLQLTQT